MPLDGPTVIKHYQRLKEAAATHFARCEEMAPYLAPSRVGITGARSPGQKQTRNVYDSTTMMSAEMLAMFIASYTINPAQRWGEFELADPVIGKLDVVREYMEECRDRWLKALSASPFYAEGPEAIVDWAGFGTGFLIQEEAPQPINQTRFGFRGFHHRAVKTGRFVIADGADGRVNTGMYDVELSAAVAVGRWKARCSEVVKAAAVKEPDKPFTFVHTIEPRPAAQQGAGAMGMPWASGWVERETKTVVHEGGYRVFPVAVPRYHKTPGEVFGRGRGDIAWPDTWTLNTAKRMGLEDWALKIRPPVLTRHDAVIGTLRLIPGGPTSINTRGLPIRDTIMPFETGSRPEVSAIKEEELRKSIREIFFVEQIRQLMEVNKSEMTAFEFARKLELLFRLLGPVYGRSEWEFLHPITDMGFDQMYEGGAFSPPPPEIFQTDGRINVTFQNPIAKAQRAGDAEALALAMNDIAPLAQLFPQMLDRFDPDEITAGVVANRGVAAKWTRSDDQIAALRDAKQAAEAQQQQIAAAQDAAAIAKDAAPMVKVLSDRQQTRQAA